MGVSNIGFLYYRNYFDKFIKYNYENKGQDEIEKYFNQKNQNIFQNSNIESVKNIKKIYNKKIKKDDQEIFFKTTYPGLLIGSGYNHIINKVGEFKLGFEFDYTTGLPIINGSSIKGLLRSAFYEEEDCEAIRQQKKEYLKEVMKELKIHVKEIDIEQLRNEIFEGKKSGEAVPMYERDIFYDAVVDIDRTEKINNDCNKRILGEDFITPHKNPLKNPMPLKFLKVMPNVVWRFSFNLKKGIMKKEDKIKLFQKILFDFGIGAKTNVGYGRFDENYDGV